MTSPALPSNGVSSALNFATVTLAPSASVSDAVSNPAALRSRNILGIIPRIGQMDRVFVCAVSYHKRDALFGESGRGAPYYDGDDQGQQTLHILAHENLPAASLRIMGRLPGAITAI
jgi:hypothetical protein